ncbi:FtsW/RodA/SpoVE family cell cycle protein [Paenibacillus amylolyticus]|uniref:FtsW/RodA/SpoVE family cell cycle protein n=1 Tax=Paenibacillus amylolyticus TaxID=1451 RepID=UPI0039AFCCF8
MTNRHERIQHYLDHMCVQVKAREVHNDLRDELGNHMEEIKLYKKQEGYTEEEAIAYAIEQMGDPAVVGKSMHRLHRHRMHWGIVSGIIVLATISLILMWIFTTNTTQARYQYLYSYHVKNTVVGLMMMSFFIFFDYRKWKKAAWWIYILFNALLWINPMLSSAYNGIDRYLSLPFGFVLDVTTVSMWILPLAIGAIMLDKLRTSCSIQSVLSYIAMVALPAVLLFQISDWVRMLLFGIVSVILFGWITRKWLYMIIAAITTGSLSLILLLFMDEYRRLDRFSVVFNLQDDPNGNGFVYNSIMDIVRTAGWWGNGLDTRFDLIKSNYFDFPGVMLIDVFGWSAGILLLIGIFWFVSSMVKILPRIRDDYGRMIILSVTTILSLQMIYSLVVITGKVPIISIAFPFIGYGTHLIFEYAMIGLLLGVYRRKDTISKKNEKIRQKVDADLLTNS